MPTLRHVVLQHFAFVVHVAPQIMRLTFDLHKAFVQMPLPTSVAAHSTDPISRVLGGEQVSKSVPPESDSLAADSDIALKQQVLHIPKRKRKPDVGVTARRMISVDVLK